MRRMVTLFAFIVLLLSFAGYLYYSGKEYEIRISERQIQEKLSERLPLTKTYLFIFRLTLDNPRVKLLAESGRIKAGLDMELDIKMARNGPPLSGSVDASGRLKYVAEEGRFYLAEPVIEQLSIEGLPEEHVEKAKTAIEMALSEYYATHPIYTLKSGRIKQAAARLVLKDVSVSGSELVIKMGL